MNVAEQIRKAFGYDAYKDSIYNNYYNRLNNTHYYLVLTIIIQDEISGTIEFYKRKRWLYNSNELDHGVVTIKDKHTLHLKTTQKEYLIRNGRIQKEIRN